MAVVTNMRLPQTMGLECAKPGTDTRQRMFVPFSPSHVSGSFIPSATPDAAVPRNDGQLPVAGAAFGSRTEPAAADRTIFRTGTTSLTLTPSGNHVLRSRK